MYLSYSSVFISSLDEEEEAVGYYSPQEGNLIITIIEWPGKIQAEIVKYESVKMFVFQALHFGIQTSLPSLCLELFFRAFWSFRRNVCF